MSTPASTLAQKTKTLALLFEAHQAAVRDLQRTAVDVLLRELEMEEGGDGEKCEWARGYLEDEETVFRHYRKQGFSPARGLTALRTALALPLPPPPPSTPHPALTVLPSSYPSTPPTLHVALSSLSPATLPQCKEALLAAYEDMRFELADTGQMGFYCVIDVQGAKLRDMVADVVPWFTRNVQPRYPSMCAAVFVINYTWAYAGLWALVRRLVPAQALSRIFFLSPTELASEFPHSLPPPSLPPTRPPSLPLTPAPTAPSSPSRRLRPILSFPSLAHPLPLSFSALDSPGPERTTMSLLRTLLGMWAAKLGMKKWWGRWGWMVGVLVFLIGRRWTIRRGLRESGR